MKSKQEIRDEIGAIEVSIDGMRHSMSECVYLEVMSLRAKLLTLKWVLGE